MRSLSIALVLIPGLAAADKLTLEQVIDKAMGNPKVQMAEADAESAGARLDEADAARYPRVKGSAFATISPEIRCVDTPRLCLVTEPQNFAFKFSGFYGSAQLDVTQPIYTFGKIGHARAAARAGLDAQKALADEAAGDVAVDAARAYWGLKVARELGGMLDDGIEEIEKAKQHLDDKGSGITIQDKQRVAVLLAEARVQRAEAAQGEAQALAGLRAVTGDPTADVDDRELAPVDHPVPDPAAAASAAAHRPQRLAASSGATAADELAQFEKAQLYPDIALVGTAVISHAQGVDEPPTAFAWDPYRRTGAGAVIGLQWTIEPWNVSARAARARGEAIKARAQSELAARGAEYDAQLARSEAAAAHDKVSAAGTGEKAARTWLAAVLQNEAIGTAEARDLADAYIAWFQMRARWATAVVDWNVAVIHLQRAGGEFHAGPNRPR